MLTPGEDYLHCIIIPFSELRKEASDSRVYAGIHYRFTQDISVEMGVALGNKIAKVGVAGPEYK